MEVEDDPIFANESGGHRWQRVSPTERKGRVHTSSITVAVFTDNQLSKSGDGLGVLEWSTTRGSGAGGQNRNKNETAVILKHKESGIMIRAESEKSQLQNKENALRLLRIKLIQRQEQTQHSSKNQSRRDQIGRGERGDKRRTIRADGVKDHITGKTWTYENYMRGNW